MTDPSNQYLPMHGARQVPAMNRSNLRSFAAQVFRPRRHLFSVSPEPLFNTRFLEFFALELFRLLGGAVASVFAEACAFAGSG
jgi:hypothetical protein